MFTAGLRVEEDGGQTRDPWITDRRTSLLIIAPSTTHAEMGAMAGGAGFRVTGSVAPDALAERLAMTVGVDTLLVDLRGLGQDDPRLLAVLTQLLAWPAWSDAHPLLLTDLGTAEIVAALLHVRLDRLLCEPTPGDIAVALCMLAREAPVPAVLHDIGRESEAGRLEELSAEVRRLAETIDRQAGSASDGGADHLRETDVGYAPHAIEGRADRPRKVGERGTGATTRADIRTILQMRRLRDRFLPDGLFADPAWDMMLDLMGARLDGKRVSVSSLCIAAAVPPTTALRWISQLTERGIFQRSNDPDDARRVFISLSEDAAERLVNWFAAVRRTGINLAR